MIRRIKIYNKSIGTYKALILLLMRLELELMRFNLKISIFYI